MSAIVLGALGAAGLIGSALANKSASDTQVEQQKALYSDSKQYNSSIEQVKRLRAAGLNPALAYGTGSSEVSAPNLPTRIPFQNPDLSGLASLSKTGQEVGNIESNTRLQQSQAQGQEIENNYIAAKNLSSIYHTDADSWLKDKMSDLTKLDIKYNELSMNDRLRQIKNDIAFRDALTTAQDLQNMYLPIKLPQEVQESVARQYNLYKTGAASMKQASAAIMQAVSNAGAFDAQYGGDKQSRAQYFNATLRALDALGSERMSNSFKRASSAVIGLPAGTKLPNPITAGQSASYWEDWHKQWSRNRSRK